MATPTERPLRRDAERNRARILDAAAAAFAEGGLDVSMDEVARRAAVGVATVYRRFPEREALIDALFDERLDELVAISAHALGRGDAWEGLAWFLEHLVAAQARDRGLRELFLSPAHAERRVERARSRIAPIAQELLARAHASGELRADVTAEDLGVLQLMLLGAFDATRDADPDAWRRYLGVLLDGLRARRDGPSPLRPAGP
jgi:AcrR family transcriptional regulator